MTEQWKKSSARFGWLRWSRRCGCTDLLATQRHEHSVAQPVRRARPLRLVRRSRMSSIA